MPATPREAKEFLVDRIVTQARMIGEPLTEAERRELYFSEHGWMPPEMESADEEFDEHHDRAAFEHKIRKLARAAREALDDRTRWDDAVHTLSNEDHYLSVMLPGPRARGDLVKLILTALAIVVPIVAAIWFFAAR